MTSRGAATAGKWTISNDDCPWTCGDARTAIELGEELGHTEILFSIQNESQEPIAYLPWEPLADIARQEELRANAAIMSSAAELCEALEQLASVIPLMTTIEFSTDEEGQPCGCHRFDLGLRQINHGTECTRVRAAVVKAQAALAAARGGK